jgi:hypothetical protein
MGEQSDFRWHNPGPLWELGTRYHPQDGTGGQSLCKVERRPGEPKRPSESPPQNATFHDLELITLVGQHVEHHGSAAETTCQLERAPGCKSSKSQTSPQHRRRDLVETGSPYGPHSDSQEQNWCCSAGITEGLPMGRSPRSHVSESACGLRPQVQKHAMVALETAGSPQLVSGTGSARRPPEKVSHPALGTATLRDFRGGSCRGYQLEHRLAAARSGPPGVERCLVGGGSTLRNVRRQQRRKLHRCDQRLRERRQVAVGIGDPRHLGLGLGGDEHSHLQCRDQRLREGRRAAEGTGIPEYHGPELGGDAHHQLQRRDQRLRGRR